MNKKLYKVIKKQCKQNFLMQYKFYLIYQYELTDNIKEVLNQVNIKHLNFFKKTYSIDNK